MVCADLFTKKLDIKIIFKLKVCRNGVVVD
jgi:hypothetical protein